MVDYYNVDISNEVDAIAARSTVTFVSMSDGACLGSGTLVRFGSLFGVLTCAHALEAIQNLKPKLLGFVLFPAQEQRQQRWTIPYEWTDAESLYGLAEHWAGPDIGFLRLPFEYYYKNWAGVATIVDLEIQAQRNRLPPVTGATEAISGAIAEFSDPPLSKPLPQTATLEIGGLRTVGKIAARFPCIDLDRLYFRPTWGNSARRPTSFQGTSGGGVWRIGPQPGSTPEKLVLDRRLIGVAYYQTKRRNIICHGPSGIYGDLLTKLRAKWSKDCPPAPT